MLPTIDSPVLIMALAAVIFLLVPLIFERLRLPSIVGLILAGAAVGPFGLGLLERSETIQLLGTVGLLYLMFVAGLEIDVPDFIKHRRSSLTFGLLTFAFPMLLPLAFVGVLPFSVAGILLVGAIVASHTPIAYPIASRLGVAKNPAVTAAMGGTLVTDTLSLVVLAIIASYVEGASSWLFWIEKFALLAAFVFVIMQGLPRLGRWFFRYVGSQATAQYLFLLVALFASAFLAEQVRSKDLIGAFLAGLALNPLVPDTGALMNRMQFIGNSLFIPFFLLSVGMLVNVQVLASPEVWLLAGMLTAILLVGKLLAALVHQRLFHYTRAQMLLMLGLSLPQAAATLAVTFVGFDIGLFDENMVNAVVVLIMVSCLIGPWLVERFGRHVGLENEQLATLEDTPQRLLLPITQQASSERLIDLAGLLRDPSTKEALFPLAVVDGSGSTATRVVSAEKRLAHTVMYAAGADLPTTPLVRIATNSVIGTLRAVHEQRISDVLLALEPERESWLFESPLQQLLAGSTASVWAARLHVPPNTFERITVFLPPLVDHHPGYQRSLRALTLLASRLARPLHGVVIQGSAPRIQADFTAVRPSLDARFSSLTWGEVPAHVAALTETDLVVLLGVRRGSLTWSSALGRLEHRLLTENRLSLLLHYASEPSEQPHASDIPKALTPERVLCGVNESDLREVVTPLIQTALAQTPELYDEAMVCLFNDPSGFSVEVLPEAFVAHARVDIPQTMMFMVTSPIALHHHEQTRRVAGVLLSSLDDPPEYHHEQLATLANFLHRYGDTMCQAQSFDELMQRIDKPLPEVNERGNASLGGFPS